MYFGSSVSYSTNLCGSLKHLLSQNVNANRGCFIVSFDSLGIRYV